MTTIYDRLKSDHDRHRQLLSQLVETCGDSEARRKLWETFFYEVGAHAAAEEEAFYAPLMEESKGQPKARHSVSEHHDIAGTFETRKKKERGLVDAKADAKLED